ncbi:ras-specific guanine nucleotide-releasing factor RalGPS1-like [Puntigrus tetrazona]|uniref:ras-specific guanine nucleotide-releasing factor RalGPS1-like n=1 Tax=Puntigrus tetrazona TaxID=1606681 RepID=UPI001C8A89C9|nr:ras-specific guanine nucleotide-releasing factor RalGPS1-like [Puntigrus tetrazona]
MRSNALPQASQLHWVIKVQVDSVLVMLRMKAYCLASMNLQGIIDGPHVRDATVGSHIPTPPPHATGRATASGNASHDVAFRVVESKARTLPIRNHATCWTTASWSLRVQRETTPHSSSVSNGISIGSSQSSFCEDLSPGVERGRMYATLGPNWRVPLRSSPRGRSHAHSPSVAESSLAHGESGGVVMEGPLKRKTLLKEGRKPKLASWTRYWITLCGSTLLFYGSKALRAAERKHYKSSP